VPRLASSSSAIAVVGEIERLALCDWSEWCDRDSDRICTYRVRPACDQACPADAQTPLVNRISRVSRLNRVRRMSSVSRVRSFCRVRRVTRVCRVSRIRVSRVSRHQSLFLANQAVHVLEGLFMEDYIKLFGL
jgi:hypothetical protein